MAGQKTRISATIYDVVRMEKTARQSGKADGKTAAYLDAADLVARELDTGRDDVQGVIVELRRRAGWDRREVDRRDIARGVR